MSECPSSNEALLQKSRSGLRSCQNAGIILSVISHVHSTCESFIAKFNFVSQMVAKS